MLTEDEVRSKAAKILNFKNDKDHVAGIGQLTTFKKISKSIDNDPFANSNKEPDGWYFNKHDMMAPALLAEFKSEDKDLNNQSYVDEIQRNMKIVMDVYKNVLGLLYNGSDLKVFRNEKPGSQNIIELRTTPSLQDHSFYENIFTDQSIDTQEIYNLTRQINDLLHFKFGVRNLYDRMIFTAATLVAKRYGAFIVPGMNYDTMQTAIISTLNKHFVQGSKTQNSKMSTLVDVYSSIKMNITSDQKAIDSFIDCITKISDAINSQNWNGEDVMGIFFNEFNRYKGKSDNGQVFTPDHITSLMYRLINVHQDDVVFDGACGSGAFLTKSMSNMIQEVGGPDTRKAKEIKAHQLYGIEIDRMIWSLAASNMLLHKDGHSGIVQGDTTSEKMTEFMHDLNFKSDGSLTKYHVTKVLMNPPFERKYGCTTIVKNVFDNMPNGTDVALILPDHKLEKDSKRKVRDLLKKNRILKIIKLPDETFSEGISTSIFIWKIGEPQGNNEIFTCEIKDDGLETVKNQGRQDVKHKWQAIEDYWVKVIARQSGDDSIKWITPDLDQMTGLSYPVPEKPFEISDEDFYRTVFNYEAFKQGVDVKALKNKLSEMAMYNSDVQDNGDSVSVIMKKAGEKRE